MVGRRRRKREERIVREERLEQVTLMERRSPNTRGLQERGNKAPGGEEEGKEHTSQLRANKRYQ